jgi:hypothetical protein
LRYEFCPAALMASQGFVFLHIVVALAAGLLTGLSMPQQNTESKNNTPMARRGIEGLVVTIVFAPAMFDLAQGPTREPAIV